MGSCHSTDSVSFKSFFENRSNINCPICQKTGKLPSLSGRFHIINDNECKCNVCNTIFNKSIIYKSVLDNNLENSNVIQHKTEVETEKTKYIKSD